MRPPRANALQGPHATFNSHTTTTHSKMTQSALPATRTAKVVVTHNNLHDAVKASRDPDMFAGYENSLDRKASDHKHWGITEYLVTESGRVFFISNDPRARYKGVRYLNEVTGPHSCMHDGPLYLGCYRGDLLSVMPHGMRNNDNTRQICTGFDAELGTFLTQDLEIS